MKLIDKTFIYLAMIGLGFSTLEAKSLEIIFDHATQETFSLKSVIENQMQEGPFETRPVSALYCQQLTLENIGNEPIKECFPYINEVPSTTLERLAYKLSGEKYPLLALYQLWNRSLVRQEDLPDDNGHPLDLLNFKGTCSSHSFEEQFIKLCHALGIQTRLANIHGKMLYDFCCENDWHFLDLAHQQLYLGLDNQTPISSEEVMDDPFLALRTAHRRRTNQIDFKQAWKQLANFEILEAVSAIHLASTPHHFVERPQGFDLYPRETLIFDTPAVCPELAAHERRIAHTVNFESRLVPHLWQYQAPFPIQTITNHSSVKITLIDQQIELEPNETFTINDTHTFQLTLEFKDQPKGELVVSGICAWTLFPSLNPGENHLHLGVQQNPTLIRWSYEIDETFEEVKHPSIEILNENETFDYCSPSFILGYQVDEPESIWWQISQDENFQLLPSNFDQVEPVTSTIILPLISETFLNPRETYYFRVKGCYEGQWSEWSLPYAFEVNKPAMIEKAEFDQVDENDYEINWERWAEETSEPIEYLVFGSNSLDFIPSIYCDKQVNAMVNGEVVEEEVNDNLVAITSEPKIRVKGGLAYYRIVARQKGQLSIPSEIIHVYDQDFIQPRNVLQIVEDEQEQIIAKRVLFPSSFIGREVSLPHVSSSQLFENRLIKVQSLLRAAIVFDKNHLYAFPKVSSEVWEAVRPYLLPENHPAWPKLNRIFCKQRATLHHEAFKKAGFKRWRPGRWSRVSASSHPELREYFVKAYCDCELGIIYDWKRWIHRIKGAHSVRNCIRKYKLQSRFKVPHKWIYPLPAHPSPPRSSRYVRKNFILVCENMYPLEHSKNEKKYKKMSPEALEALYTVLQAVGLYDSVYPFNVPFCRDGRMAVLDTEYWGKWPVPFDRLSKYFSKDLRDYWRKITHNGGKVPRGTPQHNPPRNDRRDIPAKK